MRAQIDALKIVLNSQNQAVIWIGDTEQPFVKAALTQIFAVMTGKNATFAPLPP